jgi:hypothetical protein
MLNQLGGGAEGKFPPAPPPKILYWTLPQFILLSTEENNIGMLASAYSLATPRGLFPLALHARFLVVLPTACFCQNAILLNFTIEAF